MAELAAAEPLLLRPDQAPRLYADAVRTAVAACADDTAGQICYICTETVKEETNEGLVSGFCACRGGLSFAHVSCLARGAQIEVERDAQRWKRWYTCRQCEQRYHGVVRCALGWACWKTYVGRPEGDWVRMYAMTQLGTGLHEAKRYQDAVSVREADLAMRRRLGAPEEQLLNAQANLASTYQSLGRLEEALSMRRDVYSGRVNLLGEEHPQTLSAANNYATCLAELERSKEAKSLLRKTIPVARRVLGENHDLTLKMRRNYAQSLYKDANATRDNLRAAMETLADAERIARRVFGGAHPLTEGIECELRGARAALRAREAPPTSG